MPRPLAARAAACAACLAPLAARAADALPRGPQFTFGAAFDAAVAEACAPVVLGGIQLSLCSFDEYAAQMGMGLSTSSMQTSESDFLIRWARAAGAPSKQACRRSSSCPPASPWR